MDTQQGTNLQLDNINQNASNLTRTSWIKGGTGVSVVEEGGWKHIHEMTENAEGEEMDGMVEGLW